MSTSTSKYPKSVRGIYVAGVNGEKGRKVETDGEASSGGPRVSKAYRGWDREVRAMSLAAGEFFKVYLENHDASNEQTRDGAAKHFGKNAIKAHKAAITVLKDNSKVFDQDPSSVHDSILEHIEDLEDEYENDEE